MAYDTLRRHRTIPAIPSVAPLLNTFATIGVGPDLDVEAQDDATKRGLARAAVDGRQMLLDINNSSHPFLIQSSSPRKGREANWLPGPREGTFRAYVPGKEIVEQRWFPPAVQPINTK